ncbi:uncharacterized protein BX663DRAFT_515247 [Cokeromyces recurvatus]|uniref:uncharacterized protein n=1 Tax=Cokeromyces recurvatus TaxID=90255 RepID=UPI00221F6E86|nr:uncharacterized protein BX663DRAFT_515247 [Cokeromyces recurvatus]KAI7901203.1 hypothetical protein BX663DRAFT_515247 [Cokeromyces recurvatus]
MPNRRKSSGPRSTPKLFKCTGYGDCNMVFTRSEHLARHERKHTGEKPYKCIVPGCERMFSRFDNMMQHTQTHDKSRKGGNSRSATVKGTKVSSVKKEHSVTSSAINNQQSESSLTSSIIHSRTLPLPTRKVSISSEHSMLFPPMQLPPPQPSSSSSLSNHPYPICNSTATRSRYSWPIRRESYPYCHYYRHLPSYHEDYSYIRRRSSTSTSSSESTLVSPIQRDEPEITRRRISIDDLRLPIQDIKNIQLEEEISIKKPNYDKRKTIDITPDEFEALEGFSRFHTKSVVGVPALSSPTTGT